MPATRNSVLVIGHGSDKTHGRVTPFAVLGQAHGEGRRRPGCRSLWATRVLMLTAMPKRQAALMYRGESWYYRITELASPLVPGLTVTLNYRIT